MHVICHLLLCRLYLFFPYCVILSAWPFLSPGKEISSIQMVLNMICFQIRRSLTFEYGHYVLVGGSIRVFWRANNDFKCLWWRFLFVPNEFQMKSSTCTLYTCCCFNLISTCGDVDIPRNI